MRHIIFVLATLCLLPAFGQNKMRDSLFRELEKHPQHDTNRFKLLYHLSYYSWSSPDDTRKYAQEALDLAEELGYQKGIPIGHYMLSIYWHDQKDHQQALNHALIAISEYEKTNNKKGIYNTTEMIAGIYMSWRDYQKAEDYMKQLLEMASLDSSLADYGNLYHNLGIVYSNQKKYNEAVHSFQKALKIRKGRGDAYGQSVTFHDIAETHMKMSNHREATQNFYAALSLGREADNLPVICSSYAGLARLKTKEQQFTEAHLYFDSALCCANQIRERKILLDSYDGLTDLYTAEGNYKQALKSEQMSRTLNDSIFNEEKAALLAETQTRYETAKKEQMIQILQRDKKIEVITRNILIAAILLVAAVSVAIHRVQRFRQRKNLEVLNAKIDLLTVKERDMQGHSDSLVGQNHIPIESQDDRFLKKALEIVENHLADPLFGVEKMADEMGMSRANLLRKSKSATGFVPSEFIRNVRLKRAAVLLQNRADSVSQIAFMVGFEDQSYFAKSFKKQFGVSPSEFARLSG